MALSQDRYGAVRVGVLETLGEVLHTFLNDPGGPPAELLELFFGRKEDAAVRAGVYWKVYNEQEPQPAEEALELFYNDSERPLVCAFNFPAVALTLGAARWGEIRGYYLDLAQNQKEPVKKTLAASLGEVAKIIGQEAAQRDLVPVWWESLRYPEESVRTKAVETLETLLPVLDRATGKSLLEGLLESWKEGKFRGWRERQTIVSSLKTYLDVAGASDVADVVRMMMMKGLEDNVAAVRESTRLIVSWILSSCLGCRLNDFVVDSEDLGHSFIRSYLAAKSEEGYPNPGRLSDVQAAHDVSCSITDCSHYML